MTPYIGMIVHYKAPGSGTCAAIVTEVHDDDWVGLFIMQNGMTRFVTHVERGQRWFEIEHKEPTPMAFPWGGLGGV